MIAQPITLDDLSTAQQRAAHGFARKYGQCVHKVACHLDSFFQFDRKVISLKEFEQKTGLIIFDVTQPSLFEETPS